MNILEKMRLNNKKALVTGGARGIGKSIAIALAECGADVAIVDVDIDEAEKTSSLLRQYGVKSVAIKTDVTNQAEVEKMTEKIIQSLGGLDVAYCNAGICINKKADEMTLEEWKRVIDINLTGVFLTAQSAGKYMISQKSGSIIITASMSGHIVNYPQPQCAYNASKAGVIMLAKSLAVEWAPHNIRVNTISPGYMGTELTLNSKSLQPLIEQWERMSPVGRIGRPEELQSIAIYLAGDTSSYTTGSDFVIDGAFTCI